MEEITARGQNWKDYQIPLYFYDETYVPKVGERISVDCEVASVREKEPIEKPIKNGQRTTHPAGKTATLIELRPRFRRTKDLGKLTHCITVWITRRPALDEAP